MSELAKLAEIAAKHLSDAFLSMASDFAALRAAMPLSQTQENDELVSLEPLTFTKRDNYKIGDRVMVNFGNTTHPLKMRICDVLSGDMYLAYPPRQSKSSAREINHSQILGLDPSR